MCLELLRRLLFGKKKTPNPKHTEAEATDAHKKGYQQADDFEIDTNIDVVSDEEDETRRDKPLKSRSATREKKQPPTTKLEVQEDPAPHLQAVDSRAADYFGQIEVKPVRIERKIPQARKMKEKREKTDVR